MPPGRRRSNVLCGHASSRKHHAVTRPAAGGPTTAFANPRRSRMPGPPTRDAARARRLITNGVLSVSTYRAAHRNATIEQPKEENAVRFDVVSAWPSALTSHRQAGAVKIVGGLLRTTDQDRCAVLLLVAGNKAELSAAILDGRMLGDTQER